VSRRRFVIRALVVVAMTLVAGLAIVLWYAAYDDLPQSGSVALLESIMPAYEVQEVHSAHVDADPARVYAAIFEVTPGETALARPFLWIRALPSRLRGRKSISDAVWKQPFVSISDTAILARAPGREVVVGLIGKFWKLQGAEKVAVSSRDQFMSFDTPGFAVSTLSFHIDPEAKGCRLTTVTRVRTTDATSRREFRRYWRVIGTGSAVLRRTWLDALKARAER